MSGPPAGIGRSAGVWREPDFFDACPMTDPFDSECYWLPTPWNQQPTWFTDCAAMGPMCG